MAFFDNKFGFIVGAGPSVCSRSERMLIPKQRLSNIKKKLRKMVGKGQNKAGTNPGLTPN
jgi:hypothetical protein